MLNYRANGSAWWNETTIAPVRDDRGRLTHFIGIQHDVTTEVHAEQRLAHLAYHDGLTGLPNRRRLSEELPRMLRRTREDGRGLAVVFLDLDGFKRVNDRHGYRHGDELLRQVGVRLSASVRGVDLVARQHGDEFVIVVTDVEGNTATAASRVADQAAGRVAEPFSVFGTTVQVSASVGVALAPGDSVDGEELLAIADQAMYTAKGAGGAAVSFGSMADQDAQGANAEARTAQP